MSIAANLQVQRNGFSLDVDLNAPSRGVIGLFGPSGCGKTTILRALAGLDRHRGARVAVGDDVWQDGRRFVPTHRRRLAYVFQEPGLFDHLSVRGNIEYGAKRVPACERTTSVDDAISLLGVARLLERNAHELSGGERQRVAVARALASNPRLLLLDEPLSALDDDAKKSILPYFQKLHRECGVPMVYVTHSASEIATLADHLITMDDGRIVASGDAADVLARPDLAIAHRDDAGVVVDAKVAAHDQNYGVSSLVSAAGPMMVVGTSLPVGAEVRVRIAAREVSLTISRHEGTSILNRFDAVVEQVVDDGQSQVLVRLMVGNRVPMLARITRLSAESLGIVEGAKVVAQAKSVGVEVC